MKIKRIFHIELISGILLLGFPILCFFINISTIIVQIACVIYILLFIFYLDFFRRKKQNQNEKKWEIVNVAWALSAIIPLILTVLIFIYGSKIKTYTGEQFKLYLPLYIVPIWLIFHSLSGLLLLNSGWAEIGLSDIRKTIIELFNTDSYFEIRKSFFVLIIIVGIFFFGFAYYQILSNKLFTFIYPLLMIIQVYDYKSKIKHKQKRKFDEREKYFLFKTISISSFFFFILLFVIFRLGDDKLFGHLINEMWGTMIFPLFLTIWGITGLVMLKKE